ncbi:4'-phosphopantetheinyl transferase family protein [Streptomyces mirabilis]|uniref:4'-phosphopantetheinyl transferase family protein n=1 Tax=Streptomyces mirabilis TaxID=68239 RepID=UPI0036A2574C
MVIRIWVAESNLAERCVEHLLSPLELSRADELTNEQVRRTFVTSRALQRVLGAQYLGTPAAQVQISRRCFHCADDDHGKPRIVAAPDLDFSVSHTGDIVVLAASTEARVGVDAEVGSRTIEIDDMARVVASESERRSLAPESRESLRRALFRMWARKEATVKLTGHGLRKVPFTGLSVDGPVARIDAPPAGWPKEDIYLTDLSLGYGCVAALATTEPQQEVAIVRLARVADLSL